MNATILFKLYEHKACTPFVHDQTSLALLQEGVRHVEHAHGLCVPR